MSSPRIPPAIWSWQHSAVVAVVAVAPLMSLALHAAERGSVRAVTELDGVVLAPATVVAAVLFYVVWRIAPHLVSGWVTAALTVIALQTVSVVGLQVAAPEARAAAPTWILLNDSLTIVVVLACTQYARQEAPARDPALVGFLAGTVLALLRMLSVPLLPEPALPGWALAGLALGYVVAVAALATLVVRLPLPTWVTTRRAVATLTAPSARLGAYLGEARDWTALLVVAADVACAALLTSAALALAKAAFRTDQQRLHDLSSRLTHVEASRRTDRAVLHEINATLAGLASATELIRRADGIPAQRRRMLESMVHAELSRLNRLVRTPVVVAPAPGATTDLEETLRTLALSYEARGHTITWAPTPERVWADPDAVAAVLNILLDNATKHGSTDVEVRVRRVGRHAEVLVSDHGPGVPAHLRPRIFEWGDRGEASTGQGIGLSIAHGLAEQQGGFLRLLDGGSGGSTFCLGLPALERPDARRSPATGSPVVDIVPRSRTTRHDDRVHQR